MLLPLYPLIRPQHTRSQQTPTIPSNLLGADGRITNTGGGNTSSKLTMADPLTGDETAVLWVKGSGSDLRTATRANLSSLYMDKLRGLQAHYHHAPERGPNITTRDDKEYDNTIKGTGGHGLRRARGGTAMQMREQQDVRELSAGLSPELHLRSADLEDVAADLVAYHARFAPLFARTEQREWAELYLRGLLVAEVPRKNVEAMTLRLLGAADGAERRVRAVQHFIGEGCPGHFTHPLHTFARCGAHDGDQAARR